jgi:hypothetical protein
MNRRSFIKLSPAFPAGAVSAALVLKEDGKDEISLDLAVLKTQPGDILVLTAPSAISPDTAERLSKHFEHAFPGLKAMVLGDGLKVDGVIRTTEHQ